MMRSLTVRSILDADSPLGLDTSKMASTDAARVKSVASTKCLPGQMCFPVPNASRISNGLLMCQCCPISIVLSWLLPLLSLALLDMLMA